MNSMQPSVSMMIWRLRPAIFLPASWPQTPPLSVVLTDWLSITPAPGDACLPVRGPPEDGCQKMVGRQPRPAVTPIVEMVPHRGEWRKTLWRHAPLTAAGSDLQDPIHDLTQIGRAGPTAGPCRRQERPNQRPFFIRQTALMAGRAAPIFNASDIGPWHGHSPSSSIKTVNHNLLISLNYF